MGFNIHILSGRNRSQNMAFHAAVAASFNPCRFYRLGNRSSSGRSPLGSAACDHLDSKRAAAASFEFVNKPGHKRPKPVRASARVTDAV